MEAALQLASGELAESLLDMPDVNVSASASPTPSAAAAPASESRGDARDSGASDRAGKNKGVRLLEVARGPGASTLSKARYMLDILLMLFRRQQWKTTNFNAWWISLRFLAAFNLSC